LPGWSIFRLAKWSTFRLTNRLKQILAIREDRKASCSSSISYLGRSYQLVDTKGAVVPLRPRATVTVLTQLDGSLGALYGGNYYALQEFTSVLGAKAGEIKKVPAHKAYKPAPDYPWRRMPINLTKKGWL
jgi:hypothetical protein